ncbi:tetratricopeptide repeat protein [uncultured Salinisphaera sp.]|uniref:tetratricopeptide repeat protein n=1 Tax=uncultured Salinisphaera sp. TaxID=359372 RepID=UPI0032B24BF9
MYETRWIRCSAALLMGLSLLVGAPKALAAEKSLSQANYEKLSEARDLMNGGNYGQAVNKLNDLLKKVYGDDYASAVVLQALGYAHLNNDLKPLAIQDFERSLSRKALPSQPTLEVQHLLGRLYAEEGHNDKARATLEDWIASKQKDPSADDYISLANVYAQLADYDKGIAALDEAMQMSDEVQESHYQLLVAMQYQSKRYQAATGTLKKMIERWPDNTRYWSQLANIYLQAGEDKKAHSVLKLAFYDDRLEKETDILNLARLGMSTGVPDQAARVLETALDQDTIKSSEQTWRLVAQAWRQANEIPQAVAALDHVAEFGHVGEIRLRQAELYMNHNDWEQVLAYVNKAISAGNLDSPGKAYLLKGMAYTRLNAYDQSLAALEQARQYPDMAPQAAQWSQYVARRKELNS